MKQLTDWLVYLMIRVFICLIQAMRLETCHTVAKGLAVLAGDVVRLRHEVVDENVRLTFPDLAVSVRPRRIAARSRCVACRRSWILLARSRKFSS